MPEQDNTPVHSQGYGHAEHADDTRQAQHTVSNDAPTDTNTNAIIGRVQGGTLAAFGAANTGNFDRREKAADANQDIRDMIKNKLAAQ